MAASIKVPTIFTAEDKFTSVVRRMTSGVKSFSRKSVAAVERFDQKITGTFNKMNRFAQIGLGVGLVGLFTLAGQANLQYEDSLASVSAITGSVGEDLVQLERISKDTAKQTRKSASDVLKAYELIGSAKPELLGNIDALDGVTKSAITLSKASRMDLEQSALSLTDVMNQFNIAGSESGKVIDVLASGAKYGAAAIPQIKDAILGFGATATAANVNLRESVALVETFAAKGIKGAESGTKLRNVLTKMSAVNALPPEAIKQLDKFGVNTDLISDKQLPLIDRLKELSKIGGDATALVKVFGLENKDAAQILLQSLPAYEDLVGKMDESGVAATQAATNSNTLRYAINSIKDAFANATTATQSNNSALAMAKDALFWVSDNMQTLIGVMVSAIGLFVAMKAIVWGTKIATTGYNIALGINTALTQKNKKALIGNTIAQGAYKVAMGIGTAVTWVANSAFITLAASILAATWPILAVIAAVLAIVYIFLYWDEIVQWFTKKWTQFTEMISKAWDSVVSFFTEFSFEDMFKSIGVSIIENMLTPLKGVLWLVSKMPGKLGDLAQTGLDKLSDITGNVNVNNEGDGVLPSTNQTNSEIVRENTGRGSLAINLNDPGGYVNNVEQSGNLDMPIIGPTQGAR